MGIKASAPGCSFVDWSDKKRVAWLYARKQNTERTSTLLVMYSCGEDWKCGCLQKDRKHEGRLNGAKEEKQSADPQQKEETRDWVIIAIDRGANLQFRDME